MVLVVFQDSLAELVVDIVEVEFGLVDNFVVVLDLDKAHILLLSYMLYLEGILLVVDMVEKVAELVGWLFLLVVEAGSLLLALL